MPPLALRSSAVLALASALLLPPLFGSSADTAQEDPTLQEIEEAGVLFSSSCSTCHLPPDPDHETDRAWLSQVTDTA